MAGNVIEEYLVGIGADIDTGSFNSAMMAIGQLGKAMNAIKGAAPIVAVAAAIIGAGKAAYSTIKDVAAADMEYKKLASQMWITKDSAKSLSTTMKVMGVSQEDIAWIPELREQFFRLRNEMNELATPVDADNQLQWIREIGYDVQSLQVKLKMLKEWIAYYLIKYLQPYIKEFQQFIQWLNDKLGKNMPEIARKIAKVLSQIVSIGISAVKVLKAIFGSIYDFIESLPANVRKWAAIFAMVGAIIMSGPFGLFIAAIGGALLLMQDFMYFVEGKKSSRTLAPMWRKLLDFLNNDKVNKFFQVIKKGLAWTADMCDIIVKKLLKFLDDATPKVMKFVSKMTEGVGRLQNGDVRGAASAFGDAFGNPFGSPFGGGDIVSRAANITDNPTSDFLGNENGCTYFVKQAVGANDEYFQNMGDSLWVPTWVDSAKAQGRWHAGVDGMQAGDIVVVETGGEGPYDHVVVYDGNGGYFGNSSSLGKPVHGDLSDFGYGNISGYIRTGGSDSGWDMNFDTSLDDYFKSSGGEASGASSGYRIGSGMMGFADGGSFSGSYADQLYSGGYAEQGMSAQAAASGSGAYGGVSSVSNSTVSIGDIIVNVAKTNASEDEIGEAAYKAFSTRMGRGSIV